MSDTENRKPPIIEDGVIIREEPLHVPAHSKAAKVQVIEDGDIGSRPVHQARTNESSLIASKEERIKVLQQKIEASKDKNRIIKVEIQKLNRDIKMLQKML